MRSVPPAITALAARLASLPWVSDLWVAGSVATGDYVPGVSDLDLVAVVSGPVDHEREAMLVDLHRELDLVEAAGTDLGCVYVDAGRLPDRAAVHPTWTHGVLVQRIVSGVTLAELGRHGFAVLGRAPSEVLPPITDDDVRAAARAEVCGYWAWASRRPWMWRSPVIADLGLTSMARGRYAVRHGELLTKSGAIEEVRAPDWLIEQLRARRRGEHVVSPRLRTGCIAWRDARATVRAIRQASC
jgi:Nucleotidyltransferase domain